MRITSITLVLLSMLVISASPAATYKWTDENGNVVYSQQPPKSGTYEVIKGLHHSRSSSSSDQKSTTSQNKDSSANKETGEPSAEDLARQKEIRKRNCAAAKKNLDVYMVYRRFKNEDGTIVQMDENERQKRIEATKAQIREFCN